MAFGAVHDGHTRLRAAQQACMHAPAVRLAPRGSGSRRQRCRGPLCVCLGLLDRWSGSSQIKQRDLVQMGPLKVRR
jgi:hypothetical protein